MNRRTFSKKLSQHLCLGFTSISALQAFGGDQVDDYSKRKLKPLKAGDTVGLIAPGSPVSPEKFERALSNMKQLGLKVKYNDSALFNYGYLAGTDQQRLDDLHGMFANDEVDAIWCLRGGYGCTRLLPYINYKLIKKHPKILIGYSDVTALLIAIQQKTGMVGFHGPVATSVFTDYALTGIRATLMENNINHIIKAADFDHPKAIINPGIARGCLTGGNLSLLAAMAGTKYEMESKGKIIFIEDIGEKPYRIDRMLTQLLQAGLFKNAAGIALGVFDDCEAKPNDNSLSLIDTLKDRLSGLNIPVYYGMPFGHINDQCTFPVGIKAELNANEGTIRFLQAPV